MTGTSISIARKEGRLLILVLPAVIIWGCNFVIIRMGLQGVGPFFLAAARFCVASAPFLPFTRMPKAPLWLIVGYAGSVGLGQFSFLFLAIKMGLATGEAALLVQLQAAFTVILSALILREKISAKTALGTLLGVIGLLCIMSDQIIAPKAAIPALLAVGAALCWAISNIFIRYGNYIGAECSGFPFVIWSSAMLPLPFLFLSYVTGETTYLTISSLQRAVLPVIYLGIFATCIGYFLWVRALSIFDGASVAPFALLVPVIALLTGHFILDEPTSVAEILGGVLIISGLCVNSLWRPTSVKTRA
ncbi:EamA family transporter [Acetobacter sicerae]|uniref:EamA family transporter n=1 Tax=Acetobacter sicerae TaxID=85325 RepID=A0ABS8VUK9_9PROT|nr:MULTISPECIES: EamA family transporter [Acetobacter]MBC9008957.1 EamA family transporter [Acetobacter tropicalis]MCE0743879.1 EamA family transporter [Acetobacter sicerae]